VTSACAGFGQRRAAQPEDAARPPHDTLSVRCDDQRSFAFTRERSEQIEDALSGFRIEISGRLVRPAPLAGRPATGRAYLESRRRAGSPRLPKAVAAVLASVAHLAVDERREPGAGPLLATVYHLVAVEDISRYLRLVAQRPRSMTVTGPWPPFAFAPRFG
jgi:hypothetical protein